MTTKQHELVNGVPVEAMKEAIQKIRENPELGKFRFRNHNRWIDRGRNRSEIAGFYGVGEEHKHPETFVEFCDEPQILCGEDTAPNPVEWLLHALAGCLTTTLAFHAASRDIEIESIESEIEGEIDVRGFLGLSNDVPRGYQNIRVTLRVESDAPAEKLAELAKYSPVYNTLSNPLGVTVNIEKF